MSESFGARLRTCRERQQVSLREIAEQTKIKLSLLEGLERDDVSRWPGGIFRRAFVRAYAKAIGLDPDVIVREFSELYPDPDEIVTTAGAPGTADAAVGRAARFRAVLGATVRSLSRGVALQEREPEAAGPEHVSGSPTVEAIGSAQAITAADREQMSPLATVETIGSEQDIMAAAPRSEPDATPVTSPPESESTPVPTQPDMAAVAVLCTALAQVEDPCQLPALLEQATTVLEAVGLIIWAWDPEHLALRATLAHGYSEHVLAQLPAVDRDGDNATAAAFRLMETCAVCGTDAANGALAIPLVTSLGCGGVLAIELPHGRERIDSVRAAATIVAAQLAVMLRVPGAASAADRRFA